MVAAATRGGTATTTRLAIISPSPFASAASPPTPPWRTRTVPSSAAVMDRAGRRVERQPVGEGLRERVGERRVAALHAHGARAARGHVLASARRASSARHAYAAV